MTTNLYDGYLAMAGPVVVRPPLEVDAAVAHRIVRRSPPLDVNSPYAYLLHAWHFPDTCAIAEVGGVPAAYLSAYIPPKEPETLFVWQVAVLPAYRGRGLAAAMLRDVLGRPFCHRVSCIETTVTPSNAASEGFFRRIAKALKADIRVDERLPAALFKPHRHEAERLFHIGPIHKQRQIVQGGCDHAAGNI